MNARIAAEVVAAALGLGARSFCVCAGSRNSDLIRSAVRNAPGELWPFFEERSAGFFALGRSLRGRRPAAVLTTSGTAAAELLPAAIEAHYQGLPLILITADRPLRFRGTGAPQAIEQSRIFGPYAFYRGDVTKPGDADWACQEWPGRGPLHFNVRLEEPAGEEPLSVDASARALRPPARPWPVPARSELEAFRAFLRKPGPCIVACGADHSLRGDLAVRFLRDLGAPILAEATSALRRQGPLAPLLLRGGERVLQDLPFRKVLRLGGVPSGRWWRDLEQSEVEVFSITPSGFPGLSRRSGILATAPAAVIESTDPLPQEAPPGWEIRDAAAAAWIEDLLQRHPGSEPALLRRLSRAMGESATVFLGNSLPIREWNLAAGLPAGAGVRCFANRGANGIDGAVSTYLGLCRPDRPNWGVFGDLTALYDLAAPWILRAFPEDLVARFVVVNNRGGRIFSRLPAWRGLSPAEADLLALPHEVAFAPWADLWNLDYRCLDGGDPDAPWPDIPGRALPARALLELRPDEAATAAFWEGMEDRRAAGLAG